MDVLTISALEQESIFSILSAVLHLGNVAFVDSSSDDRIAVKDMQLVEVVAYLLKVNANGLLDDITYRVTVRSDYILFVSKFERVISRELRWHSSWMQVCLKNKQVQWGPVKTNVRGPWFQFTINKLHYKAIRYRRTIFDFKTIYSL